MKRAICSQCFKNFFRKDGYSKRYCSEECRSKVVTTKRCKPECSIDNMRDVKVEFGDGSVHTKRVCWVCRYGKYVHQDSDPKAKEIGIKKKEAILISKYGESFYTGVPWLKLRYRILKSKGAICASCRSIEGRMHIDHIKPRSRYPHLALEESNLQVLCEACNLGKGAWDETDWKNP
jgi:hypothetical protein